jgi:hypothetical protein
MGSLSVNRKAVIAQRLLRFSVSLAFVMGQAAAQTPVTPPKTPPVLGTIKSIAADTLTVATDAGAESKVTLSPTTRLLRVPPGSKDLSQAVAIPLSEFQAGDRVLVRLRCAGDPAVCEASAVIAMKKSDIAEKQAHEREEWQRHGIGGLVKKVDAGQGAITIGTMTAAGKKDVAITVSSSTILRRYAPGSVKFDDAKFSTLSEVQPGDQLRARGMRSVDGSSFTADEVVTGSFRNIAGTVSAIDAGAGTITVYDLAAKKPELVKISSDTQLRKLPPNMAQMIAARLKGGPGAPPNGPGAPASGGAGPAATAPPTPGTAGQGRGDFQQLLNRLPATALSDFQKGDAVMIVATGSQQGSQATAISILGGVEPLLQSATRDEASSILTPWSLSSGGADAAAAQ